MSHENGSNKAQKTDNGGAPTLTNALLKEIGIIRSRIIHSIVDFTSVPQTSRLLVTCKEFQAVKEEDVFRNHKLMTVCDMRSGDGLKLFHVMVGTPESPESQWLKWLDTSGVKELKLPTSVTDEEMLRMFGDGRLSELRTLDLAECENITDASLVKVARGCPNLQSLSLAWCENITDTSLAEVGRLCLLAYASYLRHQLKK